MRWRTATLLACIACFVACARSEPATHVPDDAARAVVPPDAAPAAESTPAHDAAAAHDASDEAEAGADAGGAPDAAAAPAPRVKVRSIGMHVAGGPYDEATKVPFLRAVEPHYPELARCWSHVTQPKQADVGVDLLIEGKGGKPKVSNPRSTIKAEGFLPCVVAFFEGIDFPKLERGRSVVSYSVRFFPRP